MGRLLTEHEESLAVELYQSNNEDVEVIVAELWKLQGKYAKARKMAGIGAVADKFEICCATMSKILKRHGVPRHECPVRVLLTKKNTVKER